MELNQFWEQMKAELIEALPDNAHPWIYPLEISGYDKGVLTVVTGQIMGRDLLRKNHYKQILEVLKRVTQNEIHHPGCTQKKRGGGHDNRIDNQQIFSHRYAPFLMDSGRLYKSFKSFD